MPDAETVPITAARGEVSHDEGINARLTLADLAARPPAFREGGTVTGGNSSPLNDGAARRGPGHRLPLGSRLNHGP